MNSIETPPSEIYDERNVQASLVDLYRLEELTKSHLLDTASEEAFDKFTRMACAIFGAPVSMISLVASDRHFLKSGFGLPKAYCQTREVPLSESLCKYVVHEQGPVLIPDLNASSHFASHPAFLKQGFRAYMGYPIEVNGKTIGAFCVLDYVPRDWREAQMAVMQDLANAIVTEIKFHGAILVMETKARELEIIKEEFQTLFGVGGQDGEFNPPLLGNAVPSSNEITQRLAHLATHDPLTQCFNRNYLPLAYDLALSEVKEGRCSILLGLDFDNFKQVNDSAGHNAGDRFLVASSGIVRECLGPDDTLLRIGGDEFLIILRNMTPPRAQAVAERVRKKIAAFVFSDSNKSFRITVSIGMGICRRGVPLQDMLSDVDEACYSAKAKGGNRLVLVKA